MGPDVAAEEEKAEDGGEEEGEEGREVVAAPAPRIMSRLEREQHELTHIPYRTWCPHCVRMRGRNTAHRQNVKRENHGYQGYPLIISSSAKRTKVPIRTP